MARPKGIRVDNICKNCDNTFQTTPSEAREFCTKPCAQQYKGKDRSWMEKRKQTCLEKYGNEIAFKSEQVQQTYKNNLMEKYGVDNPFLVPEFRQKATDTIKERYGDEIATRNKEIAQKISDKLKGREIDRTNFVEIKYDKILAYCKATLMEPLFDAEYLVDNKLNNMFQNTFGFKCLKCEKTSYVQLCNGYLPTCKCSSYSGYSLIEDELMHYIAEWIGIDAIHGNRRDLLPNRNEIDLYIPSMNLAIEVNGAYWHSESMGKYRDYHLYKTEKCIEAGIDLIHIMDYEWLYKKPIVKSIIQNRMGLNIDRVYARKCQIKEINDTSEVREFLDANHIQGYTHASTSLGLYFEDELVSVMTFGKNRFKKNSNELEMVRFCNKLYTNVIGGASKLFAHFTKHYNPDKLDIISFADRRFFTGSLYEGLGFEFTCNTSPSYVYWKQHKILSRMACQKHKLPNLIEIFDENKTEYANMTENGWKRIWDCGNIKYTWKTKKGDK